MGDTVEEDDIGEDDLGIVDKGGSIRENSNVEVVALKRWDAGVTQRRREDDIIDNVVGKNLLQGLDVCRRQDGSDRLESLVVRHKDGEVGDVLARGLGALVAKVYIEFSCLDGAVECGEVGSPCEELQGGTEGENSVNLVDHNTITKSDVLSLSPPCQKLHSKMYVIRSPDENSQLP